MNRTEIIQLFDKARQGGYGIGSFSPRNTVLIDSVLGAAQAQRSPVMVQMSANEMNWFSCDPETFAGAYFAAKKRFQAVSVLHLDHTKDVDTVFRAIDAGFESVMFDGSRLPYEENLSLTRQVVAYAHPRGVCVEAELGAIGGADKLETGSDETLYTDPAQAEDFARRSGCDMLAVSVGTAHGVYPVKNPKIDFERLAQIRQRTDVVLVLHGGSGLPEETIRRAIREGVGKINIATDLELVFQQVTGRGRMPNAETLQLPSEMLDEGVRQVQALVEDRIGRYLLSGGKAD